MDVAAWLHGLGLGQYERAFRDNAVDDAVVLRELTEADLEKLGVLLGHRKRILKAVAAHGDAAATEAGPPVGAAAAERRHLTVLFCDLAGSTALSARLDPEDLSEVMADYRRVVADAVRKKGGYVAKFLGDGVLAYFGWPGAHEDDAERAVVAGLAACAAVAGLGTTAGPLAARVGIATGSVVVGDLLGEGEARERAVAGEAPNLAARLQALAGGGEVVMDAATRRLTGALFACAELGDVALKGFGAPVRAWRVLGGGATESRFEALRGGAAGGGAPLLGRDEELDALRRRWAKAKNGEGQAVLVGGEPGIGKSRLVAALQDGVAGGDREDLVWFCSPHHGDSMLHPVIARLERAAGFEAGDAPAAKLGKLETLLAPGAPTEEEVALIADLLGVPGGERYPLPDLSPQRRRERLLAALLRRVEALSRRRPVLAVLEDAHWADPSTRELLDLLVARLPGLSALLVVTHRPEFEAPSVGQAHVAELRLRRLGTRRARRWWGTWPATSRSPRSWPRRSSPRPTACLSSLRSSPGRCWRAGCSAKRPTAGCSMARCRRSPCPRRCRPRSWRASTGCRRCARWRRPAPRSGGSSRTTCWPRSPACPRSGCAKRSRNWSSSGLVRSRGAATGGLVRLQARAGAGRRLRHAAARAAAAPAPARRRGAGAPADRGPRSATRSCSRTTGRRRAWRSARSGAGSRPPSWRWRARRSPRPRRRPGAPWSLLPGVADGTERARLEVDLQLLLARRHMAAKGYGAPETGVALDRALALCERAADDDRRYRALAARWIFEHVIGQPRSALAVGERLLGAAERRGDASGMLIGHYGCGLTLVPLGRFEEARAHLEAATVLGDRPDAARYAFAPGHLVAAGARQYLAAVMLMLGEPERAWAMSGEAVEVARRRGDPFTLAFVLCAAARLRLQARDDELGAGPAAGGAKVADAKGIAFYQNMPDERGAAAQPRWAPARGRRSDPRLHGRARPERRGLAAADVLTVPRRGPGGRRNARGGRGGGRATACGSATRTRTGTARPNCCA